MAAMAALAQLTTTAISCSSSFAPSTSFVGTKNAGSINSLGGGLALPSLKGPRFGVRRRQSCQGPSALFGGCNLRSVLLNCSLLLIRPLNLPSDCLHSELGFSRQLSNSVTSSGSSNVRSKHLHNHIVTQQRNPELHASSPNVLKPSTHYAHYSVILLEEI